MQQSPSSVRLSESRREYAHHNRWWSTWIHRSDLLRAFGSWKWCFANSRQAVVWIYLGGEISAKELANNLWEVLQRLGSEVAAIVTVITQFGAWIVAATSPPANTQGPIQTQHMVMGVKTSLSQKLLYIRICENIQSLYISFHVHLFTWTQLFSCLPLLTSGHWWTIDDPLSRCLMTWLCSNLKRAVLLFACALIFLEPCQWFCSSVITMANKGWYGEAVVMVTHGQLMVNSGYMGSIYWLIVLNSDE